MSIEQTNDAIEACKGILDPVNTIQQAREAIDDLLCFMEGQYSEPDLESKLQMLQAVRDDLGACKE